MTSNYLNKLSCDRYVATSDFTEPTEDGFIDVLIIAVPGSYIAGSCSSSTTCSELQNGVFVFDDSLDLCATTSKGEGNGTWWFSTVMAFDDLDSSRVKTLRLADMVALMQQAEGRGRCSRRVRSEKTDDLWLLHSHFIAVLANHIWVVGDILSMSWQCWVGVWVITHTFRELRAVEVPNVTPCSCKFCCGRYLHKMAF